MSESVEKTETPQGDKTGSAGNITVKAISDRLVDALSVVRKKRQQRKNLQLQSFLKRHRDTVLLRSNSTVVGQTSSPLVAVPLRPEDAATETTSASASQNSSVRQVNHHKSIRDLEKGLKSTQVLRLRWISSDHQATQRPRHLTYLPVRSNHSVPDQKQLAFVPSCVADAKTILDVFHSEERERRAKLGSPYDQLDTKQELEETILYVLRKEPDWTQTDAVASHKFLQALPRVFPSLDEMLGDRAKQYFHQRYANAIKNKDKNQSPLSKQATEYDSAGSNDTRSEGDSAVTASQNQELDKEDSDYVEVLDSNRNLYCRECFIYDCSMHMVRGKVPHPKAQYELAVRKEVEGLWATKVPTAEVPQAAMDDQEMRAESNAINEVTTIVPEMHTYATELSDFQKAICRRIFLIFRGDFARMANAMCAPEHLVRSYVDTQNFVLSPMPTPTNTVAVQTSLKYYSLRNYNKKWYRKVKTAKIFPFFSPCDHDGPCTDDCSCVKHCLFCTDACFYGRFSKNFFRGCDCKGNCSSLHCTCHGNSRECDPALCKCGVCFDPPNRPTKKQRCRNDSITMNRRTQTYVGVSTVPNGGWGLFTKDALKKGQFIHEYVGEIVTQEEADRRGTLSELRKNTYLFMLSSDYVIDASRQGNKARFINHSDNPNVGTKTVFVNGSQRIRFFASQNIKAQSELFINYRYDEHLANHLIDKPAKAYAWEQAETTTESRKKGRKRKQDRKA